MRAGRRGHRPLRGASGIMPRTENRGSDADHGAALGDGVLEVVAHAHRQTYHRYIIVFFRGNVNIKISHFRKIFAIIAFFLGDRRDRHESPEADAGIIAQLPGQRETHSTGGLVHTGVAAIYSSNTSSFMASRSLILSLT